VDSDRVITMAQPAQPFDEAARPSPLPELAALDMEADAGFEEITRLAAEITDCEISLVTVADEERQWFQSTVGADVSETSGAASLCAHATLSEAPLIVPDAATDPRFRDHPFVRDGVMRFYAGVPLRVEDDVSPLGTLCVMSRNPRPEGMSVDQRRSLTMLASLVTERLRTRLLLQRFRFAETDRREQRRMIEAMKRAGSVGFALLDESGHFVEANEFVGRMLDSPVRGLIGADPLAMTPESARHRVRGALRSCIRSGTRVSGDWPLTLRDGQTRTARVTSERLVMNGVPYVFCVITDGTLERTEERLRKAQAETLKAVALERPLGEILANVGEAVRSQRGDVAVVITHWQGERADIEYVAGLGASRREYLERHPSSDRTRQTRFYGCGGDELPQPWASWQEVGSVWVLPLTSGDGRLLGKLYILLRQPIRPGDAERLWLEGLADVAGFALERQDTLVELRARAEHDPLTGLANRALLEDRLRQQLRLSVRSGRPVACLLIDLDNFKEVNDTFGHHAGDELLVTVARRLTDLLRDSDTVARLGGDEFVVVLPDTEIGVAESVAGRVLDALSGPVVLDGGTVRVRPSIGLAVSEIGELDDTTVLRRADKAMYQAKAEGKGRVRRAPNGDPPGRAS